MEIGLIYSKDDPRHKKVRDFVRRFVQERGILADVVETEKAVKSPTLIINGQALTEQRRKPREKEPRMFPDVADMARALERHLWGL